MELNPYQSPEETIVRAELVRPPRKRNKWYRSYTIGLLGALCVSALMPNGVGKTESFVLLGALAIGLWIWTRF